MCRRVLPGGRGSLAAVAAAAAIAALVTTPVRAQESRPPARGYRLDFRPPADATCPSERAFRSDVAALFNQKQDVFDAAGTNVVRVVTAFDPRTKLYEATMEVRRPDGTLHPSTPIRYEADTCWFVLRQAAVAATAFLPREGDPAAPDTPGTPAAGCDEACVAKRVQDAEREGFERGRLAGRKEREAEVRESIDAVIRDRLDKLLPAPPRTEQPRRMPNPFAVGVGGLISIGYALDVAPGIVVGAEWRPVKEFSAGVEARYVFPATAAENGPLKLPVSILSGAVAPCLRLSLFIGCGVLEVGTLFFDQERKDEDDVFDLRLAAGPRAGIDVPFADRFSVRLTGDLLFPLSRAGIEGSHGYAEPFVEPVVSGFVNAGLTVAF